MVTPPSEYIVLVLLRYRCDWDDGYTAPPNAVAKDGQCVNAVVGLHYELHWHGGSIVHFSATLTLTNIAMVIC